MKSDGGARTADLLAWLGFPAEGFVSLEFFVEQALRSEKVGGWSRRPYPGGLLLGFIIAVTLRAPTGVGAGGHLRDRLWLALWRSHFRLREGDEFLLDAIEPRLTGRCLECGGDRGFVGEWGLDRW